MNILEDLQKRGILNNVTNKEKFAKLPIKTGLYIGFDPTAISLHLGNYVQIVQLLRFKQYGFKPIALIGGATGMVGDPSGKSEERKLLNQDTIIINKKAIALQLQRFGLEVKDNLDFYQNMSFLDFLRDVGKLININYMLNKEVVASRLTTGISFTEFTYQLVQGWDFKCLYEKYNTKIQLGGSDQWGNITTGIEIIRKTIGDDNLAVGITSNLLTTASGKKFGKSENNALWLDKELTSPYQLYQYLLNIDDADVEMLLKWLTFLSLEDINKIIIEHQKSPHLRYGQKMLADQLVKDIHSLEDAQKAKQISEALFGKGDISVLKKDDLLQLKDALPTTETASGSLLAIMQIAKIVKSNREGRELINGNSISLNGQKIDDATLVVKPGIYLLKKGKKNYFILKIK